MASMSIIFCCQWRWEPGLACMPASPVCARVLQLGPAACVHCIGCTSNWMHHLYSVHLIASPACPACCVAWSSLSMDHGHSLAMHPCPASCYSCRISCTCSALHGAALAWMDGHCRLCMSCCSLLLPAMSSMCMAVNEMGHGGSFVPCHDVFRV